MIDIVFHFLFTEGKSLAASRECKFIETSGGIQHNVDELLVGKIAFQLFIESNQKLGFSLHN